MLLTKSSKFALSVSVVSGVLVLLLAGTVFLNRQFISDSVVMLFYQPSASVRVLEERVDFTGDGTRIFYATQPEVLNADEFNDRCQRQEVASPILGCYVSDDRIYIYRITNQELEGIEEVTAAHEMLHAAWKRLSVSERERLYPLLDSVYDEIVDDELKRRMGYYERTQPGEFYNELHSIIATEVDDIGEELEEHYRQYFEDRSVVIGFFSQYDAVFQELQDQADSLYARMEALGESITSQQAEYQGKFDILSSDIDWFNARADRGNFESEWAFYAERAQLMQRSNVLELDRLALNADIETYNMLRFEYGEVAAKLERLDKSIDSFQVVDSLPALTQ